MAAWQILMRYPPIDWSTIAVCPTRCLRCSNRSASGAITGGIFSDMIGSGAPLRGRGSRTVGQPGLAMSRRRRLVDGLVPAPRAGEADKDQAGNDQHAPADRG